MLKNGHDSNGKQRWCCRECGKTGRWINDTTARDLGFFLDYLLGKTSQRDLPGKGRTFRRKAEKLWELWPIWFPDGTVHRVVHIDGIYLRRIAVVLIAYADGHVVGWHVARSESRQAYKALMGKIPAPEMVVCDGGTGFASARRECWLETRVQRCVFHVFNQVKRYTSMHPKTPAGMELYQLAKQLFAVKTPDQRDKWVTDFFIWTKRYEGFLAEKTLNERGRWVNAHDRLVKARNTLKTLTKSGEMFTFLEADMYRDGEVIGSLPSTNNAIEGGVNRQLRTMLGEHRGWRINRQLRAIGWWCHLHTETPLPPAQLLRIMPRDPEITAAYEAIAALYANPNGTPVWGTTIQWQDLHHQTPYRQDY